MATVHRLRTFWEARDGPNVVLLRYEDLEADLEGEMRSLALRLGIRVLEDRWPLLVEAATFSQMRGRADELAPEVHHRVWQDNRRFFNRGTSGATRRTGPGAILRPGERADRRPSLPRLGTSDRASLLSR